MDILRSTLITLFQKMPIASCISAFSEIKSFERSKLKIDKDTFLQLMCNQQYVDLTKDEAANIYEYYSIGNNSGLSIIKCLSDFCDKVFIHNNVYPKVRFSEILRWRETSVQIGEDVFIAAFLAKKDIEVSHDRSDFAWPIVCPNDNNIITLLNRRKYSELHYHMFGSSATFDLTWLYLMNHVRCNAHIFEMMKLNLSEIDITSRNHKLYTLQQISTLAAYLRLRLFELLNGVSGDLPDNLFALEQGYGLKDLNSEIEFCRLLYGQPYNYKKPEKYDYALACGLVTHEATSVLYGERKLLYDAFVKAYDGDNTITNLLYLYLLAKVKFRSEFIQANNLRGFANFHDYSKRKTTFISGTKYDDLVCPIAFEMAFKESHVGYIESRISPSSNLMGLIDWINVPQEYKNKTKFIVHFIKKREKVKDYLCRNHDTRYKVMVQAQNIAGSINQGSYVQGTNRLDNQIVGIDAASSEFGCRPEVFAQAFRYLRGKCNFRFTYHVGEDYVDIVDGLRAIDECVTFMDYRPGDRLGHCLALGVNPQEFFDKHHKKVVIDRQTCLDNIAWVLCKSEEYNIELSSRDRAKLRDDYYQTCRSIYGETLSLDLYYKSMLLRGNDPYSTVNEDVDSDFPLWNKYAYANGTKEISEQIKESCRIYNRYHFDDEAKKKGEEKMIYILPDGYPIFVHELQDKIMDKLDNMQIHIECCPSSNKVIGKIDKYESHPIFRFFDDGISEKSRHQLSVSINTDDLGVFATSLENEYSLLALALLKKKGEDGELTYMRNHVKHWLNDVADMADETRFYHREDFEIDSDA